MLSMLRAMLASSSCSSESARAYAVTRIDAQDFHAKDAHRLVSHQVDILIQSFDGQM
jgi:hypothetical protein